MAPGRHFPKESEDKPDQTNDERRQDIGLSKAISGATIRQGPKDGERRADQDRISDNIYAPESLPGRKLLLPFHLQEEYEEQQGNTPEGKVDIEDLERKTSATVLASCEERGTAYPSPSYAIC